MAQRDGSNVHARTSKSKIFTLDKKTKLVSHIEAREWNFEMITKSNLFILKDDWSVKEDERTQEGPLRRGRMPLPPKKSF